MANPDPIANAITLLAPLVAPTPDGTGAPIPTSLSSTISPFVSAIFSVSPDMQAVGTDINAALTGVAAALTKVAAAMQSAGTLTDVNDAMTALQNSLSLAQSLAPSGNAVVLNSASRLFQQVQAQLTAMVNAGEQSIAVPANKLAQLSQLLTWLASLFP
jgi:hypothetical protein